VVVFEGLSPKAPSPCAADLLLALASAGFVVLALLGAEWWARSRVATAGSDHAELHRYSERVGWEPRPGARLCEGSHCTTLNDQGYRGPALDGRGEELRAVVLGDSVAFGYGVDDDETFAARLHRRSGLEVANLGVQGYGTDQSLLRLRDVGLPLDPDVVILSVCIANDLVDNTLSRFLYDGRYPKPYFSLEGGTLRLENEHLLLSPPERLARKLRERSALYQLVAAPRSGAPRPPGAPHWLDTVEESLSDLNAAVELTARLLGEMARLADARGARTLILLHPADKTFTRGRRIVRKLRRSPHLRGRHMVDLKRRYDARGVSRDELLMDALGHLNARGHALTAEVVAEELEGDAPGS